MAIGVVGGNEAAHPKSKNGTGETRQPKWKMVPLLYQQLEVLPIVFSCLPFQLPPHSSSFTPPSLVCAYYLCTKMPSPKLATLLLVWWFQSALLPWRWSASIRSLSIIRLCTLRKHQILIRMRRFPCSLDAYFCRLNPSFVNEQKGKHLWTQSSCRMVWTLAAIGGLKRWPLDELSEIASMAKCL